MVFTIPLHMRNFDGVFFISNTSIDVKFLSVTGDCEGVSFCIDPKTRVKLFDHLRDWSTRCKDWLLNSAFPHDADGINMAITYVNTAIFLNFNYWSIMSTSVGHAHHDITGTR
jgi:hypothetical protein